MKLRSAAAPFVLLLGLSTFASVAVLATEAQASCKQGFCMHGHDEGGIHVVDFDTTWTNITHFNWIEPFNHNQYELGANIRQFSFPNQASGTAQHYAIQACQRGGFMKSSTCTPWANFTYTAP